MISYATTLEPIITNTISGLIINAPWFILIYLGFKMISKEIQKGVQQVPKWLSQYEKIKNKEKVIEWARRSLK